MNAKAKRAAYAGILNLNKPAGLSSREAVNSVSRICRMGRIGHAGTLDPLATGVLIVCVGWTTRLVSLLQEYPKRYTASFRLGASSDTDDVTGNVTPHDVSAPPDLVQVEQAIAGFRGEILQTPPVFSAVKVSGKRAYKLARQGAELRLAPKPVTIHRLQILEYSFPMLRLHIVCGSGTYIRSIGRDIGLALGCGAVMEGLCRDQIGPFHAASGINPEELSNRNIAEHFQPPLAAVPQLPRVTISGHLLADIVEGRPVFLPPELVPDRNATADDFAAGSAIATVVHPPIDDALTSVSGNRRVALTLENGALGGLANLSPDNGLLRPFAVFPPAKAAAIQPESRPVSD